MKRIACLTPLPPVKSGIAAYAVMLFRELAKVCDLTAVVAQDDVTDSAGVPVITFEEFLQRRDDFDGVICQLGNNPHHEVFYRYAMESSSVIVLHDLVLHHLIVELTLARGDVEGYVEALRQSHGEAGAAWARGRAAGLHDEIGNFLFPASVEVARRAKHIIVHNDFAREALLRFGVETPITVTGHPLPELTPDLPARSSLRAVHGFADTDRVIGMFGFVTAAKRAGVVFEAFGRASRVDRNLRLLIVGDPAPDTDLQQLAARAGVDRSAWQTTGYVSDEDFTRYLAAVDRVVNLRYPSAGETSGPLIHLLVAGKEVAVSDYGPFASIPRTLVEHIPLGEGELDALVAFMTARARRSDPAEQRAWIAKVSDTPTIAADYLRAIDDSSRVARIQPRAGTLPLFPAWKVEEISIRDGRALVRLRNNGEEAVRNPLYGSPALRIVAKFETAQGPRDKWLRTHGDVSPGETTSLEFVVPPATKRLTLTNAIEGVESVSDAPFASLEFS